MNQNNRFQFRAWHPNHGMTSDVSMYGDGSHSADYNNVGGYTEDDGCIFMQYTGLKDKNGKEIYEGDIVKLYSTNGKDELYVNSQGEILWNEFNAHIVYKVTHDVKFDKDNVRYLEKVNNKYLETFSGGYIREIVGNIFENPELLK